MRTLIASIITGAALLVPGTVQAEGCFGAGQPLFHCQIAGKAKALDLCLQDGVVLYRYGAPGAAPDLILARRAENVFMLPWAGVGSSIYEEIALSNGDIDYTVWSSVSRIAADEPDVSGGVRVTRADQTLAELTCDPKSLRAWELYPVYEAKEAHGQCWDRANFQWTPC